MPSNTTLATFVFCPAKSGTAKVDILGVHNPPGAFILWYNSLVSQRDTRHRLFGLILPVFGGLILFSPFNVLASSSSFIPSAFTDDYSSLLQSFDKLKTESLLNQNPKLNLDLNAQKPVLGNKPGSPGPVSSFFSKIPFLDLNLTSFSALLPSPVPPPVLKGLFNLISS